VYLSEALGGAKAAKLVKDRVDSIHKFRKISPPTATGVLLQSLEIPTAVLENALSQKSVPLVTSQEF
jgi:hypothetical protein